LTSCSTKIGLSGRMMIAENSKIGRLNFSHFFPELQTMFPPIRKQNLLKASNKYLLLSY
jgi:hypothetical protein